MFLAAKATQKLQCVNQRDDFVSVMSWQCLPCEDIVSLSWQCLPCEELVSVMSWQCLSYEEFVTITVMEVLIQ